MTVTTSIRLYGRLFHILSFGRFNIEYRVIRQGNAQGIWVRASGEAIFHDGIATRFIGTVIDISDRKRAEYHARLLNDTGAAVAAEHDLERIVQIVTDAGVMLSGAQCGAFFYNVTDEEGKHHTLHVLSGEDGSALASPPMPRGTTLFEPAEAARSVLRSDDILHDTRFDGQALQNGMSVGHRSVRGFLGVPVVSNSGHVLGRLLFGHSQPRSSPSTTRVHLLELQDTRPQQSKMRGCFSRCTRS